MLQRPSTHTPWCTNEIVARVPDPTAIYACACWGKFRNQRKQQQKINNENLCDLLEDWFFGVIAASAQRWTGIDETKRSEWKSRPLRFCILNVGDETRTYSTSGHRYWYSMVFGQFNSFKRIQTAFKSINTDQNCHFFLYVMHNALRLSPQTKSQSLHNNVNKWMWLLTLSLLLWILAFSSLCTGATMRDLTMRWEKKTNLIVYLVSLSLSMLCGGFDLSRLYFYRFRIAF